MKRMMGMLLMGFILALSGGCNQRDKIHMPDMSGLFALEPMQINYGNGVYFFNKQGFQKEDNSEIGRSALSEFLQKNPDLEIVSMTSVNEPYGETSGFLVIFREKK